MSRKNPRAEEHAVDDQAVDSFAAAVIAASAHPRPARLDPMALTASATSSLCRIPTHSKAAVSDAPIEEGHFEPTPTRSGSLKPQWARP